MYSVRSIKAAIVAERFDPLDCLDLMHWRIERIGPLAVPHIRGLLNELYDIPPNRDART